MFIVVLKFTLKIHVHNGETHVCTTHLIHLDTKYHNHNLFVFEHTIQPEDLKLTAPKFILKSVLTVI